MLDADWEELHAGLMSTVRISYGEPVCLVGGGALSQAMLAAAREVAPVVVATDGAADTLWQWGITPEAIIGDMDSISDPGAWRRRVADFVEISEQETTDFEKALIHIDAPLFVCAGFTGKRVDHTLAVFHAMLVQRARPVVLLGEEEVIALVPAGRELRFSQEAGSIVSLFPLTEARGTMSEGLEWPINDLLMAPGRQVGTSNRALGGEVAIGFDRPGVLVMFEARYLLELVRAVTTN